MKTNGTQGYVVFIMSCDVTIFCRITMSTVDMDGRETYKKSTQIKKISLGKDEVGNLSCFFRQILLKNLLALIFNPEM